jgi:hypothetical protein
MTPVHRAIVLLIVLALCVPVVTRAQPGGAREQPRDSGHDQVSVNETAGSASPRYVGDSRYALAQRLIFWLLVGLMAVTLVFGALTIGYALRRHEPPRRH